MHAGLLRRLGIVGLSSLEAPILAALATETPLLLIGPHGTAKSLLLTRLADALGLPFRHYNASLLNFDDLVGYPLPTKHGTLDYVRTPASIWGAGAVLFDEVSRCRPDVQNKLFPIVHERRVQGIALEGLQHRWAAMNPPSTDEDDNGYAGSEPLDAALADRFGFVLTMPDWRDFAPTDRIALIRATELAPEPAAAAALRSAVTTTRSLLDLQDDNFRAGAAEYVSVACSLLAQAGIELSARRAGMLHRAVLAVAAASIVLDPSRPAADAALVALRSSLPQRAQGIPVNETKLLVAHREAAKATALAHDNPLRAILCARDPLERLQLAVAATSLDRDDFSRVAGDVLALLPRGAREAAIVHLFDTGAIGRLTAAIAAQAGETYQGIATPPVFSESLHANSTRFTTWARLKDLLARLDPQQPGAHLHANAMAALFARKELQTPEEAVAAFEAYRTAAQRLGAA